MKEDALAAKIREKERQEKQALTNADKLRIAGEIQALRKAPVTTKRATKSGR